MRRGFGLIGLVVTAILLAAVGVIAYNVGWSEGLATHMPDGAAAAPPYYYGYGPHFFGWGFGVLWFLFIVFAIFWLFRLAFFGRRHWGGGGWGYKSGYGHGVPPGIDERMQDWHKRAHGEQPPTSTPPPPPPPPDQRSV
ncbi:MAG: hypothetical protein M3R21_03235 [Candidatus Dormibacteraeota bacterium]|nr:hypothetical protein [Candidatus Dormibacteraeota bacterium]